MTAPNDKRMTNFMWIVGIIVTVFCGAGLTVALSYGSTKQKVIENSEDILKLQKRSVDYIYIQDIIQSNYMMIDIMKATSGSKEMTEALKTWKEFQMSTLRRANPTRSISSSGDSGASK